DIGRFENLIKSDLFSSYSHAHQLLEQSQASLQSQLQRVESTARQLTYGFSDYLTLKNIIVSGLSITGTAMELFLGKLPAAAVTAFKSLFESYYRDDHRVIIYDFEGIWHNVFHEQIRLLVEAEKRAEGQITHENQILRGHRHALHRVAGDGSGRNARP